MKLSVLAASAALLVSTAAHAENLATLHKGTHWQVLQHARNSNNNPMCTMQALMGWKNKAQGAVMVKYAPSAGLFFHVVKTNWKLPVGAKVPLTVTFDDRTENSWSAKATVEQPKGSKAGDLLSLSFADDAAPMFLEEFSTADQMVISFKGGNEPPWTLSMAGTRKASEVFMQCVSQIDESIPATEPEVSKDEERPEEPKNGNPWPKHRGT